MIPGDGDGGESLRLGVTCTGITAARHALTEWVRATNVADDVADAVTLAAYEALANAAEHAYPGADGHIDLKAVYLPGEAITVTVSDQGRWRPVPADPGLRGHGLPLIARLADESRIEHGDDGTSILMRWQVGADSAARSPGRSRPPPGRRSHQAQ